MASTSLLACPGCETGPFTRNHYFTGKLLVERDFTDEQRYFIDKLRHHHVRLHGWGVVCGLKVTPHPNPACRDRFVCIQPGTAVDCCGREIVVSEEECLDLTAIPEVLALFEQVDDDVRHTLRLSVCYRECPTEDIPVLYDECSCDDTHCAPNRILESYRFQVEVDPPEGTSADPPGAGLRHVHTLAVSQARNVAFDGERERVYVLSDGAPATLVAFSAVNHSLVRSFGLPATQEPLGMAVSADGERVYLSLRSTAPGETHPLQVRVLDSDLAPVNTLTLPEDSGADVLVAAAPTGRLYALNLSNRKLYAWDAPATDTAAERQELATVGDEPSALRVAPDGSRAFAASAGGASVTAVEAASGTSETLALHAGARPVSLAAVGAAGAERLFVGDEDGHLHVFGVRPGDPIPFPDLGSASLPGIAVDFAASRGGRWIFALIEASDGSASVQVVDAHAAEAGSGSGSPLGASVPVEARPRSLAISADGRRLYAASEGLEPTEDGAPTGGVAVLDVTQADCADIFTRSLDGCPQCAEECLTLATIRDWVPGQAFTEDRIDNLTGRRLLPSTTEIAEVVRCLLDRECDCGDGGGGETGPPGAGIDAVQAEFVECSEPGSAVIQAIAGQRTLVLEIPRGCDGEDGGSAGIDDVQVTIVSCDEDGTAAIQVIGGARTLVLRIPRGCDGADGTDGADGADGENGTNGIDGQNGQNGQDGVGLEQGLTRIQALSWRHRARNAQLLPIQRPEGGPLTLPGTEAPLVGVVIGFTDEVRVNEGPSPFASIFDPQRAPGPLVDADHVFQLLTRHQEDGRLPLACRCMLVGDVVPVDFQTSASDPGRIVSATARIDPAGMLEEFAPGVAWVFNPRTTPIELLQQTVQELWVALRGDFVVDRSNRAADVEFARAELPTGDRPSGIDFGAQGGVFDSWFGLNREQPVPPVRDINLLGRAEIRELSGVSEATAARIERAREAGPFVDEQDFRARVRPSAADMAALRHLITQRPEEG